MKQNYYISPFFEKRMSKKIFLGADHAGFEAKEKLKKYFDKKGIEYEDLGNKKYEKEDDYPDFAFKVAEKVSKDKSSKGILICGTGAGMAIAANKVNGIRAVEAYNAYSSEMSRKHNDSNILCLGARTLFFWRIKRIINIWLKTDFSKEERHKRRINKISNYEK